MVYRTQIASPSQPVACSLGSEMYVRVEINFKRTRGSQRRLCVTVVTNMLLHLFNVAQIVASPVFASGDGVFWRRAWCSLRQTAADSNSLPLYGLAFKSRWSFTLWLSRLWRPPCSRYVPTDVSEERSAASRFTFSTARCLPYPKICSFGLYCELCMPCLLTQPFRYTWTLFYFATRTASPVPFRRVPRCTHFSSVCCSYVALVFCVFTDGPAIVCLPLAESRHI